MWKLILLFVVLTPGILFTVPVKKGFRGVSPKVLIAAVHALIFAVILNFFRVTEGYQDTPKSIVDQLEESIRQLEAQENRIESALAVDIPDHTKSQQLLSDSRIQMGLIDAQIKSMLKTIRENAVQLARTKDAVTVAAQTVSGARTLFEADLRESSRIKQPLNQVGPELEYRKSKVKKHNENISAGSASIKAWGGSISIANQQLKKAQTAASSANNGSNRTLISSTTRALETALTQVATYTDKYKNAEYKLTNDFSQLSDDKKILDQTQSVMDRIQKDIQYISAAIERDRIAMDTAGKALISAQESMNAVKNKAPIDEQTKKTLDGSYRVLDRDVKYYSAHTSSVGKRISSNSEKLIDIQTRLSETKGRLKLAIDAMLQNAAGSVPPTVDPPIDVDPPIHVDPIPEIPGTFDLGSSLESAVVDLRDVLGTSGIVDTGSSIGLTPEMGSGMNPGGGFSEWVLRDINDRLRRDTTDTVPPPACGIQ